ncbi:MAG: GNAT family N-acetyltransferase [Bacteroidia bacterium]
MDFSYQENYIFEDDIVRLRPLEVNDLDYLLEYSLNEPDIWSFNARGPIGEENLKAYIEEAIKQRQNRKEYPFIVYDKRNNKYCGSTRFYDIKLENKTMLLGYTWYGKKFQGTGINKHCKFLLLDFAFSKMNMERVEFRANSKNERSLNAMKSIGCTVEGVLRNIAFGAQGERINATVLSILKTEWDEKSKDMLRTK